MISPIPGPGYDSGAVCRDHTASSPSERRHRRTGQCDPRQRPAARQQRQHREADTEHQRQPGEHPRRQRDPLADRRLAAGQHVQSPGAAGVRQHKRQQQHEHPDGDDQRPCAGVDFARDAAFGRLDVALERLEVAVVGRRSPAAPGRHLRFGGWCADAGHAEADTRARALPGRVGVTRAGAAVEVDGGVGDQVMRCGAGDRRGDDVTGADLSAARVEVHQPAVAGPPGHPRGAGVLATLAGGDQQLDSARRPERCSPPARFAPAVRSAADSVRPQRLWVADRPARRRECRAAWSTGR